MKEKLLKFILPIAVLSATIFVSCSNDNGSSNRDNKDNDNRGNHSTDPALPSDAEYPGSETYDSLRTDSTMRK